MLSHPTGPEALAALVALARRHRLGDPTGPGPEAADLAWWSRHDQRADPDTITLWSDPHGPVAAVFATRFRSGTEISVLCLDHRLIDECRDAATELVLRLGDSDLRTAFDGDDPTWSAWAEGIGFARSDDVLVTTWRDAARPPQAALPDGYRLCSRGDLADRPHHMIARNGDHVADRLAATGLYRPDHDLVVVDATGDVAGYGLFWPDPVTAVGLVEPMRTEDAHQGVGLGRAILTEGMRRLIDAGCSRLKISYFAGNDPAERLYLGVGFEPAERTTLLERPATP